MYYVIDNVTGERVSQGWDTAEKATSLCYGMNLAAGPGGRYGVADENGVRQ